MKLYKKSHGVIVPLVTPFDADRKLDITSLEKLLDSVIDAAAFPFILGTTGECMSMSLSQRLQLAQQTGQYVKGRATLYAGISDNSLLNTLDLADAFKKAAVDIFVAHLPSYYPLKEKQILDYFNTLADKVPAPLMLYNIPSTTHLSIPLEIVEELSHHPNICGLKDSERSPERMQALGARYASRDDFSILSGWTVQSLYALQTGFDGIVPNTANLVPHLFVELFNTFGSGNLEKAAVLQQKINRWADLHQKDRALGDIFSGLKILMQQKGLCQPYMLPPLSELDEQSRLTLLKEKELLTD